MMAIDLTTLLETVNLADSIECLMLSDELEAAGRIEEAEALRGDGYAIIHGGKVLFRAEDIVAAGDIRFEYQETAGEWVFEGPDGEFENTTFVAEYKLILDDYDTLTVYQWRNVENPNTAASYETECGPYVWTHKEAMAGAETFLEGR